MNSGRTGTIEAVFHLDGLVRVRLFCTFPPVDGGFSFNASKMVTVWDSANCRRLKWYY